MPPDTTHPPSAPGDPALRAGSKAPITPLATRKALALPLLLSLLLTACSNPATHPAHLFLRDAETSAPIPGATILAEVPSRDHPLSIDSILGRTGPLDSRATTNAEGRADIALVPDRPVRIGILRLGYPPSFALLDPAPAESTSWLSANDVSPSIEFRIER